jgi:SAM-dependent methyltransferase
MNDNELNDELFCLKFELDSLAEVLLRHSSERWVPGYALDFVENDHLQRYELACPYVTGKTVLDIACGVGRGSRMMAEDGGAKSVLGCDLSTDAIRYASHRNERQNVEFRQADALELDFDGEFDAVVSFETIEHVPEVDRFLTRIGAAVKQGGILLISTPISHLALDSKPANPYHTQEWGFEAFHHVVSRHFQIEKVFLQLYPPVPQLRLMRLFNKVARRVFPTAYGTKFISTISEWSRQYPVSEMGRKRVGLQVVVCRKNGAAR